MYKADGTYNDDAFREMGGTITDDGSEWTDVEQAFRVLDCCDRFRAVCEQIGTFIGVETFRGGYDEIPLLANSQAAQDNPVQALMLGQLWQAADDECNYKAEVRGIPRPRWWYCCWDISPEA
jgi:hypothetical protein